VYAKEYVLFNMLYVKMGVNMFMIFKDKSVLELTFFFFKFLRFYLLTNLEL